MSKKKNFKGKPITITEIVKEFIEQGYTIRAMSEALWFKSNDVEGYLHEGTDRMGFDLLNEFDKMGNAELIIKPIPRSQAELRRVFDLVDSLVLGG